MPLYDNTKEYLVDHEDAYSIGYDCQHESFPAAPECPYAKDTTAYSRFWSGAESAYHDLYYKYDVRYHMEDY